MEVIYHKVTENQRDKQIYSVKNQVVCHLFNAIKLQRFYDIAIPVSGGVLTHGDSACPFNEERVANKSLYFDAVALASRMMLLHNRDDLINFAIVPESCRNFHGKSGQTFL